MGSVLAGLKAGAVASLFFAGAVSLFNILLLLAFKGEVLSYLSQSLPASCPAVPVSGVSGTAETCFTSILVSDIPVADFLRTGLLAIIFAVSIGVYFEYLPGPTYFRRILLASMIMVIVMVFIGLYGLVTTQIQAVIMITFETGASVLYALLMARLYRRFTREVEFQAAEGGGKVFVDKRNVTGKRMTYGINSKHNIEVAGTVKPFKSWVVSGGVQVKESKQAKTSIKVTGDGLLRLT